MAKTVLVVDDDPTQRRLVQAVLDREGYNVVHAENGGEAIDRMTRGGGADVVLLDMVMPGLSGMETLTEMRTAGVRAPVIILTASGGIDTVVKAMQAGAQDFFVKPASPERILVGVGKEVIARALHGASDRAGRPFVAVNCGALPANLVESILFGHEKGSFTGATDKHLGKFAEANGGTLFLDEIGELPLDMQVKLLRALQEGEIDPVGSKRPVKVDVRIVSATNRDPAQQVKDGQFREDLFYRLNVFPIEAPALRDRREDIPALVDHFIARFNAEEGRKVVGASPETMALLTAHDWPGNVRQLENAVYRAIVLADSPHLQPHDFPAISGVAMPMPVAHGERLQGDGDAFGQHADTDTAYPAADQPIRILDDGGHLRTLEDIERDLIQHAIEVYAGHMSEIARRLGIGRSTLYRKVREQGLEGILKEAS